MAAHDCLPVVLHDLGFSLRFRAPRNFAKIASPQRRFGTKIIARFERLPCNKPQRGLEQAYLTPTDFPPPRDRDSDINTSALSVFSDQFTRKKILDSSVADFHELFHTLLEELRNSRVRSKLRDNETSFEGTLQLSKIIPDRLGFSSLLGGHLYMTILRAARQADNARRSECCFNAIVDKLRQCSELGSLLYSRCSDSRVPANHVNDRLKQAYRLHLDFLGAIVNSFDEGPLGMWRDQSESTNMS